MEASNSGFSVREGPLVARINRVDGLNCRALGLARANGDELWDQLAGLMDERQKAIEDVFALPLDGEDARRVRAMADSVRETDEAITLLVEEKKVSIARQYVVLTQGQHAQSAYRESQSSWQDG